MLEFFKNGGVYLFDESDERSESGYYEIEDCMGEEEGADITEAYIDEDGEVCLFYDSGVLSEEEAIEKYEAGDFVSHF